MNDPRPSRSAEALSYIAASALAVLVLLRMSRAGEPVNWTAFLIVLLLACIGTRIRVKLPGLERPVSLAFPFAFAAIPAQPPWAAWLIVAGSELFEHLSREGGREGWARELRRAGYRAAVSAIGVFAAWRAYAALSTESAMLWPVAAALAAAAYFAVASALHSLRIGFSNGASPWKVWNRTWFWAAPIYLLAPIGVFAAQLFSDARSGWDALMGAAIIAGAYWYLHSYFPRLQQHQHHVEQLAEVRQRALETLAVAIEAKDGSTAGHLQRVKLLASRLARKLGCNAEEVRTLQLAALLHDVGKVGVPDYILQKPSRLTDREFQEITAHASIGAGIVSAMEFPEPVDDVVLSHHEHWDGSGYPRGLSGEEIPRLARILTVVDCFDALVSDRPYRKALSIDKAVELLRNQSGKIFDPRILEAFLDQLPAYADELRAELEREAQLQQQAKPDGRTVRQTWIEKERDIVYSSRSISLQKLSRRPDHMVAFYQATNLLGADLHYERSMHEALSILAESCGAEIAAVFLINPSKSVYTLQSAVGLPEHCLERLSIPEGRGLIGRAAQLRIPVIDDSSPGADLDLHSARHFESARSTMATPLLLEDRPVGMLVMCSRHASGFDQDQSLLLSLMSEKLARTLVAAQQLRKLRIEAVTDPTTNLPNKRSCFQRLEQEINRAQREKRSVAVLFMDLNGLKPVNDSYGHAAGNKLLAATAKRLRTSLRSYDFVARIGGDEFLALLPGVRETDLQQTVTIVKKAVSDEPAPVGEEHFVRPVLSIGAAHYPSDSLDPDELVSIADQRMYIDKEASRHRLDPEPVAGD